MTEHEWPNKDENTTTVEVEEKIDWKRKSRFCKVCVFRWKDIQNNKKYIFCNNIMMSHDVTLQWHGLSIHRQLNCWFNGLFKLTRLIFVTDAWKGMKHHEMHMGIWSIFCYPIMLYTPVHSRNDNFFFIWGWGITLWADTMKCCIKLGYKHWSMKIYFKVIDRKMSIKKTCMIVSSSLCLLMALPHFVLVGYLQPQWWPNMSAVSGAVYRNLLIRCNGR